MRPTDRHRPRLQTGRAIHNRDDGNAGLPIERPAPTEQMARHPTPFGRFRHPVAIVLAGAVAVAAADATAAATGPASGREKVVRETPVANPKLDHSGSRQIGKASFYAQMFFGRKMADGKRMSPHDDNAASKTLPLGTVAKVTNLETGRSAVVTIQDRGPYVKGRIVDLSPSTAQRIGITRQNGVAAVEVAPIAVPQPDGSVKSGAAADERPAALNATPLARD
jgi:rare lipoprotein A